MHILDYEQMPCHDSINHKSPSEKPSALNLVGSSMTSPLSNVESFTLLAKISVSNQITTVACAHQDIYIMEVNGEKKKTSTILKVRFFNVGTRIETEHKVSLKYRCDGGAL